MGAVVAPLPEPPAEQVTETKLGESLHRLPALREPYRGSARLGREHLKRNGRGALGCCLLKNLVDAHIVLL